MNAVEKRIWELASHELGRRKKFIRRVRRQEIIPDSQYSWLLFEKEKDSEPVETVILNVSRSEALAIDRAVNAEVIRVPGSQSSADQPPEPTQ